jgi:hypothetical protein
MPKIVIVILKLLDYEYIIFLLFYTLILCMDGRVKVENDGLP